MASSIGHVSGKHMPRSRSMNTYLGHKFIACNSCFIAEFIIVSWDIEMIEFWRHGSNIVCIFPALHGFNERREETIRKQWWTLITIVDWFIFIRYYIFQSTCESTFMSYDLLVVVPFCIWILTLNATNDWRSSKPDVYIKTDLCTNFPNILI